MTTRCYRAVVIFIITSNTNDNKICTVYIRFNERVYMAILCPHRSDTKKRSFLGLTLYQSYQSFTTNIRFNYFRAKE